MSTPAPTRSVEYGEAVARLLRLGLEGRSLKWDLEAITRMLNRLGRPDRRFTSVHVAGTNGKGSVAAMLASVLRRAGYRTGLYTSPHLRRINERVQLDGRPISDEEFASAYARVESCFDSLIEEGSLPHRPSYFEAMTALALSWFAEAGAEIVVLETGLGGRLDATNAVTPAVAVINSVHFDHERWLGSSIEQIAYAKAGIIKPGVPVLNAAEHPVARDLVARTARELNAPLREIEESEAGDLSAGELGRYSFTAEFDGRRQTFTLGLPGRHQIRNALAALAALEELQKQGWEITADHVRAGLRGVQWPGRLQFVPLPDGPLILLDGAHNPGAAHSLAEFWRTHLAGRRVHLVYGSLRDKAVEEIAEQLFPLAASVLLTEPRSPRATGVKTLAALTQGFHENIDLLPEPTEAFRRALSVAGPEDVVLVAGSLYLVGDFLAELEAAGFIPREREPEAGA